RLGRDRVLQPDPVGDHRPEVANRWVSVADSIENISTAVVASAQTGHHKTQAVRPFWLLAQPVPLPMKGERPVYGSVLRLVRGPERIEAGWWEGGLVARDYFVAEDEQAARYWIYRERDADVPGWFLHGLFA